MTKGRIPPRSTDPTARLSGDLALGQVYVTGGFGQNTRRPFVEIELPAGPALQLEVDEARLIAHMILEAAESAEQDMGLVAWVMSTYDEETEDARMRIAAGLLREIRVMRARRRNQAKTTSA